MNYEDILSLVLAKSGGSGGGGGGSDFSTCKLTINGNTPPSGEFTIPCIIDDEPDIGIYPAMSSDFDLGETYDIPLYKGTCYGWIPDTDAWAAAVASVSGNIEVVGSNMTITGDCTITTR